MINKAFLKKWALYAAVLIMILAVQSAVLNRVRIFGVSPLIIPAVIAVVATFEGPKGGSGFGLFTGILYETAYSVLPGVYILVFTLIGALIGAITGYLFPKSFVSCLVFSFSAHFMILLIQIARLLIEERVFYFCMLSVAGTEILLSLVFCGPIYLAVREINGNIVEAA